MWPLLPFENHVPISHCRSVIEKKDSIFTPGKPEALLKSDKHKGLFKSHIGHCGLISVVVFFIFFCTPD